MHATFSDDDASPPALWAALRHFMQWLFSRFGAPAEILALAALTPDERRDLLSWLAPLEALLRRLLLIDAAALTLGPPRPARAGRPRTRRIVVFDPERPETWRVSFRVFPRAPRKRLGAGGRGGFASMSPWSVALRAEALLRAFNEPAPIVRRLARRLSRTPGCAETLCAEPRQKQRPGYADWHVLQATRHARLALKIPDSS